MYVQQYDETALVGWREDCARFPHETGQDAETQKATTHDPFSGSEQWEPGQLWLTASHGTAATTDRDCPSISGRWQTCRHFAPEPAAVRERTTRACEQHLELRQTTRATCAAAGKVVPAGRHRPPEIGVANVD